MTRKPPLYYASRPGLPAVQSGIPGAQGNLPWVPGEEEGGVEVCMNCKICGTSMRRSLLRQTKIATAEARLRKKAKKDQVRQATIQGTLPDTKGKAVG